MNITENMYQVQGRDSDSAFNIEINRAAPDWFTDHKIQIRVEKKDDQVFANCSLSELKELHEAIGLVIEEIGNKSL